MSNFNVKEMSELAKALDVAFAAMQENVKKVQDTATDALEEVRKEGTLHAKTNEALTALSEAGKKSADEFKEMRDRVLELEQKTAQRLAESGGESHKSIFEIVSESAEYKAAGKSNKMDPVNVKSFHAKTGILNATGQNQPLVPSERLAGIIVPAEQRLYIRDLIPQAVTSSNLVEYASEASFTNNAGPQYDSSPGSTEGARKNESAMTFTLANAAVVTLAH